MKYVLGVGIIKITLSYQFEEIYCFNGISKQLGFSIKLLNSIKGGVYSLNF